MLASSIHPLNSLSGTLRLSPEFLEMALFGRGILVPIVEARLRSTKLKRKGPELSEAILVPAENADRRRPPLEERWLSIEDARELHTPTELSVRNSETIA
ncbi:hypothetical protein Tcan_01862 [Toxocara canis]|uniref:Uncharacterized protein n=1 Tax=Toxocara canis TaxID=6265 RepID=A0A0B2VMS4_TOXCA|nr:hypothetical protein Tcan_01862 [Toxocara canis]